MSVEDVQKAVADLAQAGVDTHGANAVRITNLVAWRLGWGMLRKEGGNRAVMYAYGSDCRYGDEVGGPGFAVDYIIDPDTKFGFDLLSDGGGANGPQWSGPETAFVDRNTRFYTTPINPETYLKTNVIDPPPPPPPPPDPKPDPKLEEKLDALAKDVAAILGELRGIRKDLASTGKLLQELITAGGIGNLFKTKGK